MRCIELPDFFCEQETVSCGREWGTWMRRWGWDRSYYLDRYSNCNITGDIKHKKDSSGVLVRQCMIIKRYLMEKALQNCQNYIFLLASLVNLKNNYPADCQGEQLNFYSIPLYYDPGQANDRGWAKKLNSRFLTPLWPTNPNPGPKS